MLLKFLGKYRDAGLLVLRVGLGIMFCLHGLPKLAAGPKVWTLLGKEMAHFGVGTLGTGLFGVTQYATL